MMMALHRPSDSSPPKVLHFVTGGFSGATQVAIDLVSAHLQGQRLQPLLVLRRKRQTPLARVEALRSQGLPLRLVPGWSHAATIYALYRICREFQPDILVGHGFSDHLWARYAGLLAGVPHLVQVEHNSRERYSRWRLQQALWLSARSDLVIGCSEGVKTALAERGFPRAKLRAIPNGIRLEPYQDALQHPWEQRAPGVIMSARFARQKDHACVLRAIALLRDRGIRLPLTLAGGGDNSHSRAARQLAASLGIEDRVRFLGHCPDIPSLLKQHPIAVLASHYEGMPLALVEAMAAGCVAVGSAVVGIRELIDSGHTGYLFAHSDAQALADQLAAILAHPAQSAEIARQGHEAAMSRHSLALMTRRYEDTFAQLLQPAAPPLP
jgi:glycosyltransferase involved in cell wall biosynthesis